jgi:hypothetical protein
MRSSCAMPSNKTRCCPNNTLLYDKGKQNEFTNSKKMIASWQKQKDLESKIVEIGLSWTVQLDHFLIGVLVFQQII